MNRVNKFVTRAWKSCWAPQNISLSEMTKLRANTWKRQFESCIGPSPANLSWIFWVVCIAGVGRRVAFELLLWTRDMFRVIFSITLHSGGHQCGCSLTHPTKGTSLPIPRTPLIYFDSNQLCFSKIVWWCTPLSVSINYETPQPLWVLLTLLLWNGVYQSTNSDRNVDKYSCQRSWSHYIYTNSEPVSNRI